MHLTFLLCFGLDFVLSFIPAAEGSAHFIKTFWLQIGCLLLLFIFICGPASKTTVNDNTSGVTTVLDVMKELPQDQRNKVAFVLFDLEEAGILGSASFASKHKSIKKNTLVINFDCVSDGETMMFGLNKSTEKYAELLEYKNMTPKLIYLKNCMYVCRCYLFWLRWVFVALCGLSLVTLHCRAWASHCGSFVLLWSTGSRVLGLQ